MEIEVDGKTYEMHFQHHSSYRDPEDETRHVAQDFGFPMPTIADTRCILEDPQLMTGDADLVGWTYCSIMDNFSKAGGRKRSFTRAIQNLDRDKRKLFWEAYFKVLPQDRRSV